MSSAIFSNNAYKILVPRTNFSGSLATVIVDLSTFLANHIQIRFGLRSNGAITGGTQVQFTPRTTLISDANYHYTQYSGVGVPVLGVVDNIGNNALPLQQIPGTDSSAIDLASFIFDLLDCQSTQLKAVLGRGSFMQADAVARKTWDIYAGFNNVAPFDGFRLTDLGGNIPSTCWYEVFQLG